MLSLITTLYALSINTGSNLPPEKASETFACELKWHLKAYCKIIEWWWNRVSNAINFGSQIEKNRWKLTTGGMALWTRATFSCVMKIFISKIIKRNNKMDLKGAMSLSIAVCFVPKINILSIMLIWQWKLSREIEWKWKLNKFRCVSERCPGGIKICLMFSSCSKFHGRMNPKLSFMFISHMSLVGVSRYNIVLPLSRFCGRF